MTTSPSSPRAPLSPMRTPPPRRKTETRASKHSRTPSEPSPLRNLTYSAADAAAAVGSPPSSISKSCLQGRKFSRRCATPVDPAEIATLLGLKPATLRSVSASSCDSDKTIRASKSSPRLSPRDSPRNSPRTTGPHSSPKIRDSPNSPRSAHDDKENVEKYPRPPPPRQASQSLHKRKLSASVFSPSIQRKQAARRNVSSPAKLSTGSASSATDDPPPSSVSTPGGTFGAFPDCPAPPMPAWLQDPSVLDVLAQLADEAQDPPSPTTSIASSVWAAILKPRESPKGTLPTSASPKDVFGSPKSTCTSLFEEKQSPFSSPTANAGAPPDTSPRSFRSPRTLKMLMGQTAPTIPEDDEEEGTEPMVLQPSSMKPVTRSPTKNARREATAQASAAAAAGMASMLSSPPSTTAQWIIATTQLNCQAEPALSASMAALTLSSVAIDPDFASGDVTLVCCGREGYIGYRADSTMIQTYFNNFPVLSQVSGVTHVPLRESAEDIKTFLRFVNSQSIDVPMTAKEVLAIHRIYNLYDATELARLTLAFWVYHNPVSLSESLGMTPTRLELFSFLRLAAELRSVDIWRTTIQLLMRGWWRSELDPHRMTAFDVAVMGDAAYRALQFLASQPDRVWDNLHEYSVSRDKCGNFCMSRVSLTGYSTFVDSSL